MIHKTTWFCFAMFLMFVAPVAVYGQYGFNDFNQKSDRTFYDASQHRAISSASANKRQLEEQQLARQQRLGRLRQQAALNQLLLDLDRRQRQLQAGSFAVGRNSQGSIGVTNTGRGLTGKNRNESQRIGSQSQVVQKPRTDKPSAGTARVGFQSTEEAKPKPVKAPAFMKNPYYSPDDDR